MIHFFPYLKEQIYSGKTGEDICAVLRSVTDSGKILIYTDAEFAGQVYSYHFRVSPGENLKRNSFLPVITGTVTERKEGCVVDVSMQLTVFARIFTAVWSGFLLVFFLGCFPAVFSGEFHDIYIVLLPIAMVIGGQIMMRCGFHASAKKALKELRELIC